MTNSTIEIPENYDIFVSKAVDLFIKKDTDYNSRFIRGLITLDARSLWSWEVDKKLDRIRTWIERKELQVKGEGVYDSVIDLFNYTVQFWFYLKNFEGLSYEYRSEKSNEQFKQKFNLWQTHREDLFRTEAYRRNPLLWVNYLIQEGRVKEKEQELIDILLLYMGDKNNE